MIKQLMFIGCIMYSFGSYAQENTVATGEDASGLGGSVSYSIGQIDYISNTNGYSSNEGVQQPIEFFVVLGLDEFEDLSIELYPNPAGNTINIKTDNFKDLKYQLVDNVGKILLQNQLSSNNHQVDISPPLIRRIPFKNNKS